jgi:hypothetical protein
MPDFVKRASFYEGQIVGAADLNLAVSYDRDSSARHLRLQHTWGIVSGLEITGTPRTTPGGKPYKEVTVAPGVAVDGTGRAIVATEPTRAPEERFIDLGVVIDDPDAWYPVFLQGRDEESRGPSTPSGACQATGATRVTEVFEITFGRLSGLDDLDAQLTVDITDGPGGMPGTLWKILLGFVQWDDSIGKFKDVADAANGIRRRYAGVRAGEVIGAGGELFLRSGERDATESPAVRIASGDKGKLEFGKQGAAGTVTPVLTVDTDGNLTVTGKIVGALAGRVQVESGIASDGMLLPLPAGITQKRIDDGEVVVQSLVTPRFQAALEFDPAQKWFPHVYECYLEGRRVRCRIRWIGVNTTDPPRDRTGVCDYLLMAFPRSEEGSRWPR